MHGDREHDRFAREAGVSGPSQWAWELKTVNGRGLDVRLRYPPGFDAVGEDARGQVQKAFTRGQCQLNLTITRRRDPAAGARQRGGALARCSMPSAA